MKRYVVVKEFFGVRVYDSMKKTECYYDQANGKEVVQSLGNDFDLIDNCRDDNRLSAPLKISMNITKKCNLRCKQCFSESGEKIAEELSTKDVCKLFDDMRKCGTFFICIGGGEPLMREDLNYLLEYGHQKQLAISIVSNGLLFTRDVIENLNKYHLDTIWISLEGLKSNHERLRGEGTFEKALEAISLLKSFSNAKIAIRVSLSKFNLVDYPEIIRLAEKFDVDILRFTPLLEYGRAKGQDLTMSQKQYIQFMREIVSVDSPVHIIHPNKINTSKFWISTSDFGCHCGKEAVWIDELGRYSPCFFFGESYFVGNINKDDYLSLWEKALISTTIQGNETCKECSNYMICRGGCRARALAKYGSLNEIDPLCPLMKNNENGRRGLCSDT